MGESLQVLRGKLNQIQPGVAYLYSGNIDKQHRAIMG